LERNSRKQETLINKFASIERLPPLIPAKSPKEVNKISKYFKSNKSINTIPNQAKLYTQLAKNISNTKEVLRIKEAFPSLKTTKIDNIQQIIKGNNNLKLKLHINITTKGPSHKSSSL